MKKLNGFQLKLFMALLMVLDHIPHITGLVPPLWAGVFHGLTRCVGVWFAFTAVEGFKYTRNRWRYNFRLFGWALFMGLGNRMLQNLLDDMGIRNNIFLTLAMGVLILNIINQPFNSARISPGWGKICKTIVIVPLFVFGFLGCEGGMVVIPFMLITWFFRNKQKLRNVLYLILAIPLFLIAVTGLGTYGDPTLELSMFLYNSDWLFITVIPFLYLYNGERGRNTPFAKYFFYVFYPAHLWLIALINYWISG